MTWSRCNADIRTLDDVPSGAAIVDAIPGLARSMNLPVVAEGVETPVQFEFVRAHGCSEMQGYFLDKPLPEAEV